MKNEQEIRNEKKRILEVIEKYEASKRKSNSAQKEILDSAIIEFKASVDMLNWVLCEKK